MQTEARLGDLFHVLRRSWRMIAAVTVTGTALICAGPLLMPPRYTAKSQILVEPQGLMSSQGSVIEVAADEASMQTEIAALTSPDLVDRLLAGLPSDPAFKAAVAAMATNGDPGDLRRRLTGWAPLAWFTATGHPGPISARRLLRHLQVSQENGSHVVAVSVTSASPEEAAAVANRLTRLYVDGQDQQKRASTDRTLSYLATRAPQLRDEVQKIDAAVMAYRLANNMAGTNPTGAGDGQTDDLNRQLEAAETEEAVVKARADMARRGLPQSDGTGSPVLAKLREREMTLLQTIAAADASFVHGSPVADRFRAELAEVRRQMAHEGAVAAADLEREVTVAAARVQSIRLRLAAIRSDSTDISLSELGREAASSHRLYENLLLRQEQLREQRESLSPGVRVLSLAQPPIQPSSVNPVLFVPPALSLSFIFASFLAVGKANLDRTLRSGREVTEALGIPCIGIVPEARRLRGSRPHQALLGQRSSPYAEAIRCVVASLQIPRQTRKPRVLLFSSSVPAEGKTTLAVSVAVCLATLGRRVVLVDLDFRRPAVVRELGGGGNCGLLDVLDRGRPVRDSVRRVPGLPLDFLAAPRGAPAEPLALFASGGVPNLFAKLREEYDDIIVDSAPLLVIAETRLLLSLADAFIFVVEWGKTRRDVAMSALSLLPSGMLDAGAPKHKVSAVISRVNLKKHARYNYGDSGECLVAYGSYFAEAGKARQ